MVSKSRKQTMKSQILPKIEQNTLRILSWVCFVCVFGRIKDIIICFWDLLTFSRKRKYTNRFYQKLHCRLCWLLAYLCLSFLSPFSMLLIKSGQRKEIREHNYAKIHWTLLRFLGRNSYDFFVAFLKNFRYQKFVPKLTDL